MPGLSGACLVRGRPDLDLQVRPLSAAAALQEVPCLWGPCSSLWRSSGGAVANDLDLGGIWTHKSSSELTSLDYGALSPYRMLPHAQRPTTCDSFDVACMHWCEVQSGVRISKTTDMIKASQQVESRQNSQRCSLSARASLMATLFSMLRLLSPAPARFSDRLITRSFDGPGAGA